MKKNGAPIRRTKPSSSNAVLVPKAPPRDRIALFAFELPGEPRAPIGFASHLADALEERGLEVHLFSNQSSSFHRVHRVQPGGTVAGPVAQARALCAAAAEHIGRISHEIGPFIALHAIQWSSVPAVLSAARHGGARSVVTFLDTVFSRFGHVNGSSEVAQIRRLEQQAVDLCDVVLAGSEPIRQEVAWLYGSATARTLTVDAVENPEKSAMPQSGVAHRLAFAGSWDSAGGADLFLETARVLAEDDPSWRFVVSEDVVSRARLEADLRRRGQTALFARIDVEKTAALALSRGVLALVPARQSVSSAPVFAAWRAGCPVIVARTGPCYEVEDGVNGRRAFPFAKALADAVRAAASDPKQLQMWGEAGRRKVENQFTWPAVAAILEQMYRETTNASVGSYG